MRHWTLLSFWILLSIFGLSHPLSISDDEEIPIDGYGPEIYIDHQLDNEEVELLDRVPLEEPTHVRVRRMAKYRILESSGLHSHFKQQHKRVQDEDVLKINPHRRRFRRSTRGLSELHSDEVEDVDSGSSRQHEGSDFSIESVPQAQKQTMNPAAYYRSDNTDRLADKWVKAPYGDYQSRSYKEEEDSQGEQSGSVSVKARQPRVNFITQQGQTSSLNKDEPIDGPEARERERERERDRDRDRDRDQQNSNSNTNKNNNNNNNNNDDDRYKKPLNDRYYPPSYHKPYDPYERPQYPYDRPVNPYERPVNTYNPYYRDQYGYNPYYEKYDPYYDRYYPNSIVPPDGLSRMAPPNGMSSSFYYRHQYNDFDDYLPRTVPNYYYSDNRFELPMEPRQPYDMNRPYLYSNDVNNKPGRIVYYANLPEVVRTPSNYRSATARYGDPQMYNNYYYNNYDRDDYHSRTAKAIYNRDIPSSTTMRIASTPIRSDSIRERSYYG